MIFWRTFEEPVQSSIGSHGMAHCFTQFSRTNPTLSWRSLVTNFLPSPNKSPPDRLSRWKCSSSFDIHPERQRESVIVSTAMPDHWSSQYEHFLLTRWTFYSIQLWLYLSDNTEEFIRDQCIVKTSWIIFSHLFYRKHFCLLFKLLHYYWRLTKRKPSLLYTE